jgi:hypothetical protein
MCEARTGSLEIAKHTGTGPSHTQELNSSVAGSTWLTARIREASNIWQTGAEPTLRRPRP